MKGAHENVDEAEDSGRKDRKQEQGSRQESVVEKEAVPVEEDAVSEEFPSDLHIQFQLLAYYTKHAQEACRQRIDIGFGLQFGDKVDPAKVVNRIMELEHGYLKIAGKSDPESSLLLPEDKLKFRVSKLIWHRKYGQNDQIADIELLRSIIGCSTKKQDDAKRIKKLQKKYLRSLKMENGIGKYSMSPEDEEFYRLSSIVWDFDAADLSEVSGQEWKSSGRTEEALSPTKRTLNDVQDIEILNCTIAYCAKNKAFPEFSQLIPMCRDFLHIDVKDVFLVSERFARLRWKYMISLYDQEIFRLSHFLWGDTLGDSSNQDSAEESSPGGEEDDTDKNKNDKKDESPKS